MYTRLHFPAIGNFVFCFTTWTNAYHMQTTFDEHKMATEKNVPTNSGIWHGLFSVTEFGRPPNGSQFIIRFRQSPFIHQLQCSLRDRMIRHANHHLCIWGHILLGGWAANASQKRKQQFDQLRRGRCQLSSKTWKRRPGSTVPANTCCHFA